MIFSTFVAMAVAHYFGAPTLPILVVAALLQGVLAFILSKRPVAIGLTMMTTIAALTTYVVLPLIVKNFQQELPLPLKLFDYAMGAVAVLGLIAATMIGIAGVPEQSGGTAKQ